MLDTVTKRRIDTARDILVGKVPDPKSQVEQITIALIYKFMDDMDAEAEDLGGKRKFFTGKFARYGWAKLMSAGIGGHELISLYGEGISSMPQNPGIPVLFRDIFKNAYLPYRDPETLKSFLKIIDEFSYDHSERLGDAFEYLLSILGSQGDAGQFRTPRHIIDFIVEILEPKKGEVILDPACGTAGFLISAYKHILRTNTNAKNVSTLTPDEKGKLAKNFKGYDISPDMVRLSLVNLYLHGFTNPQIFEYDTLTSEDRWNEFADVILANPPFMSPKGGIKPHKRFSIQAKRSEVLFVDYIAEHLTPTGRAGIIVPEGIIFQSGTAYKDLRKMLVENSLVAVISLPAGVFNPYSGVKTSILILDKSVAKINNTVAFFKIENDGFDLGAQRRANSGEQLSKVKLELSTFLRSLRMQQETDKLQPSLGIIVKKENILSNRDYSLSGERYRANSVRKHSFQTVSLGEASIFHVESGGTPKSDVAEYWGGSIHWATLVDLPATDFISEITNTNRTITERGLRESSAKIVPANSIIVSTRATIGRIAINRIPLATNQGFKNIVVKDLSQAIPEYIALALTKLVPTMKAWATGGTFAEISKSKFCELQIPLPPFDKQKDIVAEIEQYQKVINGARTVIDNYRPNIPIKPDWPLVSISQVCIVNPGKKELNDLDKNTVVSFVPMADLNENEMSFQAKKTKTLSEVTTSYTYFRNDDVLVAKVTPCFENGKAGIAGGLVNGVGFGSSELFVLRCEGTTTLPEWVYFAVTSKEFRIYAKSKMTGTGGLQRVPRSVVEGYKIPLPSVEIQQQIILDIKAEQSIIAANRELVARFEKKVQSTLARVWGDDTKPVNVNSQVMLNAEKIAK